MLMTEHLGTYQLPPVQARVARLVEFYQTIRAHVIASETEGFISPAGLYKPNVLLSTSAGRTTWTITRK
ncbi:4-hydroxyphenylacetate 3-hydroxylase C-terminal domain-containing protein [Streptomyces sp. F001]|uniref:4-hydroxyphenylacetate 3-hydroxylase C-terminal domain-containing protein n=1 Tax=Streptomyces sp. F001 TaxID=1510026 RepID=UPI0019D00691|nr:4-hydroxyphenylacetate 3-hydroxylase C-terminal domain-containing protein [Streptomyces sp. F001]